MKSSVVTIVVFLLLLLLLLLLFQHVFILFLSTPSSSRIPWPSSLSFGFLYNLQSFISLIRDGHLFCSHTLRFSRSLCLLDVCRPLASFDRNSFLLFFGIFRVLFLFSSVRLRSIIATHTHKQTQKHTHKLTNSALSFSAMLGLARSLFLVSPFLVNRWALLFLRQHEAKK